LDARLVGNLGHCRRTSSCSGRAASGALLKATLAT